MNFFLNGIFIYFYCMSYVIDSFSHFEILLLDVILINACYALKISDFCPFKGAQILYDRTIKLFGTNLLLEALVFSSGSVYK